MNKLFILILIISSTVFFSCKKDKTEPAPVTNTPIAPPADGSPSSATQFSGIFTSGNYNTITSNTVAATPYAMAKAYFTNQPTPYIYTATSVMVNKVYLNGDTVGYNATYKYYFVSSMVNLATETWSVNGANGIGSFSVNINAVNPGIDLPYNFPDSVSKSVGFTMVVNNVTNAAKANLFVHDGTNSVNGSVSKMMVNGNNTITFSPADLANLTVTNNGFIFIVLNNSKAFVYSGKDFQFNREAQYTKYIKIKP